MIKFASSPNGIINRGLQKNQIFQLYLPFNNVIYFRRINFPASKVPPQGHSLYRVIHQIY